MQIQPSSAFLNKAADDFSRYIIAWRLCTKMKAEDATDTLTLALRASGCDSARVVKRPRLLSDNGPCYVAGELADWLEAHKAVSIEVLCSLTTAQSVCLNGSR